MCGACIMCTGWLAGEGGRSTGRSTRKAPLSLTSSLLGRQRAAPSSGGRKCATSTMTPSSLPRLLPPPSLHGDVVDLVSAHMNEQYIECRDT